MAVVVSLVAAAPPPHLPFVLGVAGLLGVRAALWFLDVLRDQVTSRPVAWALALVAALVVPGLVLSSPMMEHRDFGKVAPAAAVQSRAAADLGVSVRFERDLPVGEPVVATTRWAGGAGECVYQVGAGGEERRARVQVSCPQGR